MNVPRTIFLLLCFFIPYSEAMKLVIGPAQISTPYVLAMLGIFFIVTDNMLARRGQTKWKLRFYTPVIVLFAVYASIGCLSIVRIQVDSAAHANDAAFLVIEQIARLFLSLGLMVFVSTVVTDASVMIRGLKMVCISAGLVSMYGIYQVIGTFFGFYRPIIPHTASYGLGKGAIGASRAIGTMLEPSYLAAFLCFSIIVTVMLMVEDGALSGRMRRLLWLSLGIQGICMILTTSTIGFLGLAVSLVVIPFFLRNRTRRRLIPILLVVTILVTVPTLYIAAQTDLARKLIVATVDKPNLSSANERTEFIRIAVRMFEDHPVIGVGPGLFNDNAWDYTGAFASSRVLIANNVYAELLSETGLVGFIVFMSVFAGIYWRAHRRWRDSGRQNTILAGLATAIVSLSVQFLAYPTFKMEFIWLLFGLVIANYKITDTKEDAAA